VALAAAVLVVVPLTANARPLEATAHARSAAAAGTVYGGATSQDLPVVIELNKRRTKVVRAHVALRLSCTAGGSTTQSDVYKGVKVSKKGKFSSAFGPVVNRNDDATTTDVQGSISGKLNATRTKVSGTWQLKLTFHDAAGAVTDTCDSGKISWKGKQ
jgi:hypothetical protein